MFMDINFNYYSTPLWFAFSHAWIYVFLLWKRSWQNRRLSDFLLGLILVGMSFNIWEYMLGFSGIHILWKQLYFFPTGLGYAFAPICYYYFVAQVDRQFRFKINHIWGFLPFIIHTFYHVTVFSFGNDFVKIVELNFHHPFCIPIVEIFVEIIIDIYYFVKILKFYKNYQNWTKTQFSDIEIVSFKWFRNLLIILALIFVIVYTMQIVGIFVNLDFKENWWEN